MNTDIPSELAFKYPFVISTLPEFSQFLLQKLKDGDKFSLLPTTLNEIYLANHNSKMKYLLHQLTFLTPDGMPIVILLRLLTHKKIQRLYGPDLLQEICRQSQNTSISHFFYGGSPETLNSLIKNLRLQFPGITISGYYAPPFRPLISAEITKLEKILQIKKPSIIWVGLGSEKQVVWMSKWYKKLPQSSFIAVGAAFDFLSGNKKQAPTWMQKNSLEWLFRLSCEPQRLWERYVVHFPYLFLLFFGEVIRILIFRKQRKIAYD